VRIVAAWLALLLTASCDARMLPHPGGATAWHTNNGDGAAVVQTGLYVPQPVTNTVDVFSVTTRAAGAPIGDGTVLPLQAAFGGNHLFVVTARDQYHDPDEVWIYRAGETTPWRTAKLPPNIGQIGRLTVSAQGDAYLATASLGDQAEIDQLWLLRSGHAKFRSLLSVTNKHISDVACDTLGNVYLLYTPSNPAPGPNSVVEYNATASGVVRTFKGPFINPTLVLPNRRGGLYVVNRGINRNGWIDFYADGSSEQTSRISGVGIPKDVGVDGKGQLYVLERREAGQYIVRQYRGTTAAQEFALNMYVTAMAVALDGSVYATYARGQGYGILFYRAGSTEKAARDLTGKAPTSLALGPFIAQDAP
jgi:hypothetical protein